MKKIFFDLFSTMLLCGIVLSVYSCSNQDEFVDMIDTSNVNHSHRITAEQAAQNALDFVNKLGGTTRSGLSISEVKAIGKNLKLTRSLNDSINLDSLFYIVNFEDDRGYVIAASDDRETPVFAYVEDGHYEDSDTQNNGYDAFMYALVDTEINKRKEQDNISVNDRNDLENDGGLSTGKLPDKYEVMRPLLVTKWNQSLYNKYCSECPTGCVPTAISQICSFLKKPTNISWTYNGSGNRCMMDWNRILSECKTNGGNPYSYDLQNQISNLMRFWGILFEAEYGTSGTNVDSEKAITRMQDLGFNATDLTDYNATNVINDLRTGNRIIYMRGNGGYYHVGLVFRKYVDGHGWVVDGYIYSRKSNVESIYLHCNWGWNNGKNGYFLSNILNADENPYFDDNANPITRSSANYRYNLQTSTICK